MKKLMMGATALAIACALGASADAQEKKQLAFVVNGASDFWKLAEAGVKKAQAELPAFAQVPRAGRRRRPAAPDG